MAEEAMAEEAMAEEPPDDADLHHGS